MLSIVLHSKNKNAIIMKKIKKHFKVSTKKISEFIKELPAAASHTLNH